MPNAVYSPALMNDVIRRIVQHMGLRGPNSMETLLSEILLSLGVNDAGDGDIEDYYLTALLETGVLDIMEEDDSGTCNYCLTVLGKRLYEQGIEHPYAEMLETTADMANEIFVAAYSAAGKSVNPMAGRHQPARAKALLKGVLGDLYRYSYLVSYDDEHPVFGAGGVNLTFHQGPSPADDLFIAHPNRIVRNMADLGQTLIFIVGQIEVGTNFRFSEPYINSLINKMKEANSNQEKRRTEFMTTSPYSTMDIRQVEKLLAGLSIAGLALESFHASNILLKAHAPERAKALLEKVLGEHTKYAWIKLNDKVRPAFEVDGIGLEFTQGATTDDDIFTASYAGASSRIPVRSFTALGLAMCDCITIADGNIILDEAVAKVYDQIEGEFAVLKIAEEFIL